MQVILNGQEQQLESANTVSELLQQLGYMGQGFAVALNGDFVARGQYVHTLLSEGDILDIVAPVVGG